MTDKAQKESYVLEPYVGAGTVRFGMPRAEVSALLGVPDVVDSSGLGELNEYYGAFRVAFDAADETVVELGFTPECDVVFDRISLFAVDDPITFLRKFDPQPRLLFGFLVFQRLGLTITGFHDGDVSQRAVCLFTRGRFERFANDMTPYDV